ncbi:MAG: aminotransferase class I/II-fold pyridoxal phosphate-dependent enzyme [Thermoanaerobaculia bacterium]
MSASPPNPAAVPASIAAFRRDRSGDLLQRCREFSAMLDTLRAEGDYPTQYRLELLSPLDHEIVVRDPLTSAPKRLVCFDSNSYLGLHLHPRVTAAARKALDEAGAGTPSAPLLSGTSRWLRDLEEVVAAFHGREAALVFPSGYAANIGILTGLLRPGDLAVRDRYVHASLHDGCRFSGARGGVYAHRDAASAARALARDEGGAGRLVVTDGVFSMHGSVAPIPELASVAHAAGALLMVDEAHATGVVGATGRGTEELFGLHGRIDVLMGTFSKAAGAAGGYVVGPRDLVDYLRFFAHAAVFTASLPAPVFAAVAEAFRLMDEDPGPRERLHENSRRFTSALEALGVAPLATGTPIVAVRVGPQATLLRAGRELYDAGIRCGSVSYPAVPADGCLLRFTVNARHTAEELDRTAETLARVAARHGFLGKASHAGPGADSFGEPS